MPGLPRRPRTHVLETESKTFVRNVLPPTWIIDDTRADYGLDLYVEIVNGEELTGAYFSMQLKATDELVVRDGDYLSHQCKTSTLRYFLERPELVVYLVYDAQDKQGFWVWIQDYVRNELDSSWRGQETATVKIPLKNKFDHSAVQSIAARVRAAHGVAKRLSAVQTTHDPHLTYSFHTTESGCAIHVVPKHGGTNKDYTFDPSVTFRFDESPEAQSQWKSLESAIKTGSPAEIDSRFLESLQLPGGMSDLVDATDIKRIRVESVPSKNQVPVKISIVDVSGQVLEEIPYLNLRVIQAGTEETTLSNETDSLPLKVKVKSNSNLGITSIRFAIENLTGQSVIHIQQILRIQVALPNASGITITDLRTGLSSKAKVSQAPSVKPDQTLVELINDLVFIQIKTNQLIRWPGKATEADLQLVKKVVGILQTGKSEEGAVSISFPVDKEMARKLAASYASEQRNQLGFDCPSHTVELFGSSIELGPAWAIVPDARLNHETREQIQKANDLAQEQTFAAVFDLSDPRILFFHRDWLPAEYPS